MKVNFNKTDLKLRSLFYKIIIFIEIVFYLIVKEQHKNLPNIMESVAEKELSNLPNEIESCSLIYLPEIGYLLGIPVWKENLTESELILPNMNFKVNAYTLFFFNFFIDQIIIFNFEII